MTLTPSAGGRAAERPAKPAASLLTVPIFRDQPHRRRSDRAPAQGPAAAPPPAGEPAPTPTPAPAPAADGPDRADAPPPAAAPDYRDLRAYWRARMTGGLPTVEALDAALIGERWPYTMLMRVPADGALDIAQVYAPATGARSGAGHPFAGDRYSQLSTWVCALAAEAFGARQIREARETFDLGGRRKRLTARLLPCRREGDPATYLLLQLQEG